MNEKDTTAPVEDVFLAATPQLLAALRDFGVAAAWVFGSVARGTERPDSDLDLLVTFSQPTTLFRQLDLAEELRTITGRDVHLMTRIDPVFEPYIRPTLVPLAI